MPLTVLRSFSTRILAIVLGLVTLVLTAIGAMPPKRARINADHLARTALMAGRAQLSCVPHRVRSAPYDEHNYLRQKVDMLS
jgi:hypothetical protein